MLKKQIIDYLNTCRLSLSYGNIEVVSLSSVHKIISETKKNFAKNIVIKNLAEFYIDPQNILNIWNNADECERDFLTAYIQLNCAEHVPTMKSVAKKHNLQTAYPNKYGRRTDIFDKTNNQNELLFLKLIYNRNDSSKVLTLFPSGSEMPFFIFNVLKDLVPKIEYKFNKYIPNKKDRLIARDNRLNDFVSIVTLVGEEKFKVKSGTFTPSVSKLRSLSEQLSFHEIYDNNGKFGTPKDAKRVDDFKVSLPLFILAANSKLLSIDSAGNVSPNIKNLSLLELPRHELIKKIYNDYMSSSKIDELDYLACLVYYSSYANYTPWMICRETIVDNLKKCPTGKFIRFEDFDIYINMFDREFLASILSSPIIIKTGAGGYSFYNYGYDEPNWQECETRVITIIFTFLSAMGILDLYYTEKAVRIELSKDYWIGISGFRITPLGEWILGLRKDFTPENTSGGSLMEGGLSVLPDYSIVISGLTSRIQHTSFFKGFLTKVSADENVTVYKLDFPSIVRAYANGIEPQEISKYLAKSSKNPLPENVIRSLSDWQGKVGRIKITTQTIIETDDPILTAEIKHIKGVTKVFKNDVNNAFAINSTEAKKAKSAIEKNGWLVDFNVNP